MPKYDLYINEKKPGIGLYVRRGSGLSDFADSSDWIFSGNAEPSGVVCSCVSKPAHQHHSGILLASNAVTIVLAGPGSR